MGESPGTQLGGGARRVLLAGNFGQGNWGDEAIVAGTLGALRALDPALACVVVSADGEESRRLYGVDAIPLHDPSAARRGVAAADLVVVGGGGLLNDYWEPTPERILFDPAWGLATHLLPVLTAAAAGKPYGLLAVGAGPLELPAARELVAAVAEGAAFVTVRDAASRDCLEACGVPARSIGLAADPCFLLEPAPGRRVAERLARFGLAPGGDWLALALRPWLKAGGDAETRVAALAHGLDRVLESWPGRLLFTLLQRRGSAGHADGALALATQQRMSHVQRTAILDDVGSAEEMAAVLGSARAVVAMRLHGMLLAALSGTPSLPIAYDPKVAAHAAELGLGGHLLELAQLDPQRLAAGVLRLLAERERLAAAVRAGRDRLRSRAQLGVGQIVAALGAPRATRPAPRLVQLLGASALAAAEEAAARTRDAQRLQRELVEQGRAAEERERQTREQLARIEGSRLWRMASLYWKARHRLGAWRGTSVPVAAASVVTPASDTVAPGAAAGAVAPLPPEAAHLAQRFAHLRAGAGPRFHDALALHFADLRDHPMLPTHFEFAATSVQRGTAALARLRNSARLSGARALDVGCAYGGFLVALARAGAVPAGIDLNPGLLELARTLLAEQGIEARVELHDATLDRADFHGAFDLVLANGVVEHVKDLDAFLANLSRWLAPAGVAYLEVPNGRAAEAVLSDGHYGLFGITLLDFEAARDYAQAARGVVHYDVFTYLPIDAYRRRLARFGLSFDVLPDSVSGLTDAAVDAAVARLEKEAPQRLAAVPESCRGRLAERLDTYLDEVRVASAAHGADYRLDYGTSSWQVLVRHIAPATGG